MHSHERLLVIITIVIIIIMSSSSSSNIGIIMKYHHLGADDVDDQITNCRNG